MTYAHVSTLPNGTLTEYRTVTAKLSPSESTDGLLIRMAGSDATGLHIIDIWESQAHAKRFEAEQLFPAFQAAGITPDQNATFTAFDADEAYICR
ncbi:MAG: hypothetical protein ACR2FU_12605 [Streptosporangiaceae bacterium]